MTRGRETEEFPRINYRKKRWPKILLLFGIIIIGIGALAWWQEERLTSLFLQKNSVSEKTKQTLGSEPLELWNGGGRGKTVLLLGADRRPGSIEEWGRSDTIILARLLPQDEAVSLLSIPRDLQVDIPGYGFDKVNAAYSYGGPQLLIRTLRNFLGSSIDHYVEVDFPAFARLIRETDGVYVSVDRRYYNSNEGVSDLEMYSEIDLQPGYQKLGPADALSFVRFRHTDSDLLRTTRQQLFLRELSRQLQDEIRDTSLGGSWNLLRVFLDVARSDISSTRQALSLLNQIRSIPSNRVVRTTMQGEAIMSGGVAYIVPSQREKEEALEIWNNPGLLLAEKKRGKPTPLGRSWLRGSTWLVTHSSGRPFRIKSKDAPLDIIPRTLSGWKPAKYPTSALFSSLRRELFFARGKTTRGSREVGGIRIMPSLAPEAPPSQLRICRPELLPEGYAWEKYHSYTLEGHPALALSATSSGQGGVLWNWTNWVEAPILRSPETTIRFRGKRFFLWTESGAPRIVAWRAGPGYGWVQNTLDNRLNRKNMLRMAASCR